MNCSMARRNCLSPKKIILLRHSDLIYLTKRSACGVRFGLCGGSLIVFTPATLRIAVNSLVNSGLR